MSQMYIMEPPTNGKIVLRTSSGDIDIELWPKEAPLACRNFVQLCMENYYDATIFHRTVPGFITQGGDPTGTGMGGDSIYGKPFKDEFHSRLRFTHRGLVAMANGGKDDNASQFFFTLGPTNDLNKKHTIFGKITGDTIYNMVKLSEGDTDANERPINPHYIKTTHILNNPFDDIVPRNQEENKKKEEKNKGEKKKKSKAKAHKKLTVLSFGEEAEEEEKASAEVKQTIKAKSAHDNPDDKTVIAEEFKPELKTAEDETWISKRIDGDVDLEDVNDLSSWIKDQMKKRNDQLEEEDEEKKAKDLLERKRAVLSYQDQQKVLLKELNNMKKKGFGEVDGEPVKKKTKKDEKLEANDLYSDFKEKQEVYRKKTASNKFSKVDFNAGKVKRKAREADTMAMLNGFKTKIHKAKDEDTPAEADWIKHTFKREEDMRDQQLNIQDLEAKDVNKPVDEMRFDISDPRNPINLRKRGKSNK